MKKFYITTPLYYVNDKPHIGHGYTTILADVLSRYNKMFGKEVFFLTGTDEHGQKVQEAAAKNNTTPKEHVDKFYENYTDLWKKLNIRYDRFIRTTEENHVEKVQIMLSHLWEKGDIYIDEYEGLYSVSEERFITEKEHAEGDFREVTKLKEKNYFFKMSAYQQKLIDHINSNPNFIIPETRKNEILGFLKKPLDDLCISRPKDRLEWGIEIPFDNKYVTYVWFDALLNYITGVGWANDKELFNKWWPADCHLIGKDIITTHAVYWITMLMAADLPLPKRILAHGWWLMENTKISKSLGNVINPLDLISEYGEDALRFFLMREMTLGQDSSFSFDLFKKRYNDDLANDLGNLLNRITILIRKFCSGTVPTIKNMDNTDKSLVLEMQSLPDKCIQNLNDFKISIAIENIMSLIRSTNKYLEIKQPWKSLKKDPRNQEGLNALAISCEAISLSGKLLYPVTPQKCQEIMDILRIDNKLLNDFSFKNTSGNNITEHEALFPRIEND